MPRIHTHALVAAAALAALAGCSAPKSSTVTTAESGKPSMLPPGPLSTRGRQIIAADGTPVRIAGTAYWISDPDNDLPKIAAAGFNAIRVAWVNRALDASWGDLDRTVAAAGRAGVRVILDNHDNEGLSSPCWGQQANGLWYDLGGATDDTDGCGIAGTVTRDGWVDDWRRVAEHYAGNDTVIGYDLRNEPLEYGTNSPGCSWGDGDRNRDLRLAYEDAGNAIHAVDPDKLIIAEGPQNYGDTFGHVGNGAPWGDLTGVAYAPVTLNVPNKVVYSVHDYPTHTTGFSPDNGPTKDDWAEKAFGFVATQDIAPLYIGEWAADRLPGDDQAYADSFVGFYNDPKHGPASTSYWMWGIDGGCQDCGIIDNNGNVRPAQMAYVQQLLYYPAQSAPATSVRVAVGRTSAYTDAQGNVWSADHGFSGGNGFVASPLVPIAGTDAGELYNGERWGDGAAFHYSFAMKAGSYRVTLKFAELYVTDAGQRKFNVAVDGQQVLSEFDIVAAAGGVDRAVDRSFPVTLASDGNVTIDFLPGSIQNPKVDAISILPAAATSVRVAVGHTSAVTDAGGNVWAADHGASGGIAFTENPGLSIAGTDTPELYNGERYGDGSAFRYAFPLAAGSYTVTLKFAEMYVTGAGQRKFNVAINGQTVLSDFDIFAAAGGGNRAVDESFPVTLAGDGDVTIDFLPGSVQNPKVDAISITPGSATTTPPLITPPLDGATPGSWQEGDLTAAGMTMHYDFLLPHGYDASHTYPLVIWLHENDMGDPYYDNGQHWNLAGYLDGWFNNAEFRSQYPCILVAPYADQRSDPGGATANFGGWTPPGDHGANEDAAVAIAEWFAAHYSVYQRKIYVTGASLGGIGSWAMMLDYNAYNGPNGRVFAAAMPLAGVIERYGFGVDPPADVVERMRNVPVFAVHGAGDGTSQPNWDRAMWADYGGGALPGAPGAQAPNGAYRYLEDAGLGHDVWDTYYALPAGKPLYDWLFAQTAP